MSLKSEKQIPKRPHNESNLSPFSLASLQHRNANRAYKIIKVFYEEPRLCYAPSKTQVSTNSRHMTRHLPPIQPLFTQLPAINLHIALRSMVNVSCGSYFSRRHAAELYTKALTIYRSAKSASNLPCLSSPSAFAPKPEYAKTAKTPQMPPLPLLFASSKMADMEEGTSRSPSARVMLVAGLEERRWVELGLDAERVRA